MVGRLREWLRRRREPAVAATGPAAPRLRRLPFTLQYHCFRELLAANDRALELIADLEDALAGEPPFAPGDLRARAEAALLAAFVMVKNLNLIAEDRYRGLYDALDRVRDAVETAVVPPRPTARGGPRIVPLAAVTRAHAGLVGAKMANLGEIRNRLGLWVPDGFVVTATAFDAFLAHADLAARIAACAGGCGHDAAGVAAASAAIRRVLCAAALPPDLRAELAAATAALRARVGDHLRLAVRSSAIGEDAEASWAGQYHTALNVTPEDLPDSVLGVFASLYGPSALAYRREHGLDAVAERMAVGCIELVETAAGGVMFTRDPTRPDSPHVLIEAVPGQAAGAAAGTVAPDHFVLRRGATPRVLERRLGARSHMLLPTRAGGLEPVPLPPSRRASACVTDEQLARLCLAGHQLEEHFGGPQDVEWAIDFQGRVVILQTRPLACAEFHAAAPLAPAVLDRCVVLVDDGVTACPGAASGRVVRVEHEADLDRVGEGAVLVARHSSPAYARVMRRVAAIVTEVGGRTGHMAIVARELGVPTIVGAAAAAALQTGVVVTVDATRALVLAGNVAEICPAGARRRRHAPGRPELEAVGRVAALLCPLHLTEPESPGFQPAACTSLHDVTRFAHEKTFAEMFHLGDDVKHADEARAVRLRAHLPIEVYVFDLGGAVRPEAARRAEVTVADLTSAPLCAFTGGLLDPRIRWDRPRPVSLGGFLSVVGESMVGPPPSTHGLGRRSFAMASDAYLNFSTRAGYHFSTVDAYCGRSINKNYVSFRLVGGAAAVERRARRVRFVAGVLRQLGFAVQTHADLVTGRLHKYPGERIRQTLEVLGRLTLCARQLDMLMDDDAMVASFVAAFLAEDFAAFA
jgi:pyruvate,water dikinase